MYVVRIWIDEHISNDYPDLRYEVEAVYPADAAQAAHAAAAKALGTNEFFGTAVYDPALQEERAKAALAKQESKRFDTSEFFGTVLRQDQKEQLMDSQVLESLKDLG